MRGKICFIGVPGVRGEGHYSRLGGAGHSAVQTSAPGEVTGTGHASKGHFLSLQLS